MPTRLTFLALSMMPVVAALSGSAWAQTAGAGEVAFPAQIRAPGDSAAAQAPVAQAPAAEAPAPQAQAPETPSPQTQVQQTPAPQAPLSTETPTERVVVFPAEMREITPTAAVPETPDKSGSTPANSTAAAQPPASATQTGTPQTASPESGAPQSVAVRSSEPADSAARAPEPAPAADADADAAPVPESGAPDPLTPKEVVGPPPQAPGAPTAAPQATAEPQVETHPVIAAVRNAISLIPQPRNKGEAEDLAGAKAFYEARAGAPVWVDDKGFNARARLAMGEIGKADDWGLNTADFDLPVIEDTAPSVLALAEAEMRLSFAAMKYARFARGGRFDPSSISRKFDQKPVIFDPRSVIEAVAASDQSDVYLRGLHPKHEQFQRLREALLKERGAVAETASEPTKKTRSNGSRVQRILVNMERWRWMPPELGQFYVWDSIPEQMTRVYKDGKQVLSEKIVVGKLETPTPVFSADMQFIIFHPSWGVPPGMKSQELAPRLRKSGSGGWFSFGPSASSILRAHGLTVTRGGVRIDPDSVDWSTANIHSYSFTQAPGASNVLGIVKFRFPNKHDVYMHDTTERNLFGGRVRAFSHGCMRVQNPMHLAEVLLGHDKGWSKAEVTAALNRGADVELTTPIPVHVTYFTMHVGDDGRVVEFSDLYGLDSRVASVMERREVRLVQTSSIERADEGESATASSSDEPVVRRSSRRTRSRVERKPERVPNPLNMSNPFGN
ncbi:MAG: L,D-transpeptidase family protein [Hyphomicrobiaceae bacterium]